MAFTMMSNEELSVATARTWKETNKIMNRNEAKLDYLENSLCLRNKIAGETRACVSEISGCLVYLELYNGKGSYRSLCKGRILKVVPVYNYEDDQDELYMITFLVEDKTWNKIICKADLEQEKKLLHIIQIELGLDYRSRQRNDLGLALQKYIYTKIDWDEACELVDRVGWYRGEKGWRYITGQETYDGIIYKNNMIGKFIPKTVESLDVDVIIDKYIRAYEIFKNDGVAGYLFALRWMIYWGEFMGYPSYEKILVLISEDELKIQLVNYFLRIVHSSKEEFYDMDFLKANAFWSVVQKVKDDIIPIMFPKVTYSQKRVADFLESFLSGETSGNKGIRMRGIPIVLSNKVLTDFIQTPCVQIFLTYDNVDFKAMEKISDIIFGDITLKVESWIASTGNFWSKKIKNTFEERLEDKRRKNVEYPKTLAAMETVSTVLSEMLAEHQVPDDLIKKIENLLNAGSKFVEEQAFFSESDILVEKFVDRVKQLAERSAFKFIERKTGIEYNSGSLQSVYYDEQAYYFGQYLFEKIILPWTGLGEDMKLQLSRMLYNEGSLLCNKINANGYKKYYSTSTGQKERGYVIKRSLFDEPLGLSLYERGE